MPRPEKLLLLLRCLLFRVSTASSGDSQPCRRLPLGPLPASLHRLRPAAAVPAPVRILLRRSKLLNRRLESDMRPTTPTKTEMTLGQSLNQGPIPSFHFRSPSLAQPPVNNFLLTPATLTVVDRR